MSEGSQPAPLRRRVAAFLVHLFTASGALLGLLALQAASRGAFSQMFMWLGAALLVDGLDGTIARRLEVGRMLPRWSGEALDLVVDFLTYAVVPAYALVAAGLLPQGVALPCAGAIVISAALYSADRRMKTEDAYFRGFPAVWNVVAFYVFLLQPPPWIAAGAVLALSVLTFAPIMFVHPFRVARLRRLNVALVVLWSLLAGFALAADLAPHGSITLALCAIGVYFLAAGLLRGPTRPPAPP